MHARIISLVAALFLGWVGLESIAQEKKSDLTPEQEEALKQVQSALKDPGDERQRAAAQQDLKKLFSGNSIPSDQSMDKLTNMVVNGVASGQVSAKDALTLSKELAQFLNFQYKSTEEFTSNYKKMQALIEKTGLGEADKNRLMHDLYAVVTTAQSYNSLRKGLNTIADNAGAVDDQKQEAVKNQLKKMMTRSLNPNDMSVNDLAAGLSYSVGNGLTVKEAMRITTDLGNLLDTKAVQQTDFANIEKTVKKLETLVQTTKLNQQDRIKLYNQILTVVNTANPPK